MQEVLLYSLKYALKERFDTEVVIAHDGAKYPDTKPFFVVKQIDNVGSFISKGREAANIKHYFEIVFHANTYYDLLKRQGEIRDYFMFGDVTLCDTQGRPTKESIIFNVLNDIAPYNNELTDKTAEHKVHFDIVTENVKHKMRGTK